MPRSLSVQSVKRNFPIFSRHIHGSKTLIYLDSAATSQKPFQVIEAMDRFYKNSNANIHRGIHELAEESTNLYESARQKIAGFIGVNNPDQIIFTRNTTESINLVAQSWGRKNLQKDDIVVLTQMEHHSNLVPWYMLAEEKQLKIEFVNVKEDGTLDMNHYQDLLNKQPKLVSFTQMSNVLGTINPAKKIISLAHMAGALTLVDGAQSVPHFPVDVEDLDADFFAFSAHKMCGPTGIGILFGKLSILDDMPPFLGGGDMIKMVSYEGFTANSIPYKFEAGTPAIAESIGFGSAVDFLANIGMDAVAAHEREITSYAMDMLGELEDIHLIGPGPEEKGGVVSFYMDSIHPHDVAQILDSEGIAVRAGHHCAMPLHRRYNIPATTRASFYLYNTKEDVDVLRMGLEKVREVFH